MEEFDSIKPLENLNIEEVCRACFETCEQYKILSDEAECIDKRTLGDVFFDVVKIEMKANAETPPCRICLTCSNDLINAYNFIQKSQKNNGRLLQYLINANIKKPDCLTEFPMDIPNDQSVTDFLQIKVENEAIHDYDYNDSMPENDRNSDINYDSDESDYEPLVNKKEKLKKLQCTFCDRIFKRQDFYENHLKKHKEEDVKKKELEESGEDTKLECEECDFNCTSKIEMKKHQKSDHKNRKMARIYERKTERKLMTQKQLDEARELIKNGSSQRKAAKTIGVKPSTLRKRLSLGSVSTSLGRFKMTFTDNQENELVEHYKVMDSLFYGMTMANLRRLVFEFAEANKIPNRFDEKLKMAGRDWVESFLSRHSELCIRHSQPKSLAKAICFNKMQVQIFYKNLKDLYEKYQFQSSRVYNMDESAIRISIRGNKVVDKVVSAERCVTVTALCCMNATGNFVPPVFIYPSKRMKEELPDNVPNGCKGLVSDSGYINSEIFMKWLKHFIDHVHPQEESPVLLVMDNHSSHISFEVSLFCRKNNISIVTLAPHSSKIIQPLERSFFGPLKSEIFIECESWMGKYPGIAITVAQVLTFFCDAYKKVATVGNASSGFALSGIYPFNDKLFEDHDFSPASVTECNYQNNGEIEIANFGEEAGTVYKGVASESKFFLHL